MFRSMFLATLASQATGTKLIFLNGTSVVGDTSSSLVEIDLDKKTSRVILDKGLGGDWSYVDGSVVCDNIWYGVGSNFPAGMAIAMVDISNTTGKLLGIQALDFKPHHVRCGKKGELLTIGADDGSPTTFHLYRIANLTSSAGPTSTIVGTFPKVGWAGYPSIFQFTEDSLYAHFAKHVGIFAEGYNTGEFFKMDIATGNITIHKQYEGAPGVPIFVAPSDGKSTGAFGKPTGKEPAYVYYFCDVDLTGKKVKVSGCKEDKQRNWFDVKIPALCQGDAKYYFTSMGAQTHAYTPIFGTDMSTDTLTDVFHLNYDFKYPSNRYAGALACSPKSSEVATVMV